MIDKEEKGQSSSDCACRGDVYRQSIGERLWELRNQNNLTQEDLAERLMVSRQSISKWELNKTSPDVDKLIQLSELYHVSMDYLIKGEVQNIKEAGEDIPCPEPEKEAISSVLEPEQTEEKSNLEYSIRKSILFICMLFSSVLCAAILFFAGRLLVAHTCRIGDKRQEVASVERIYEQYTKAEVSMLNDKGEFVKKNVWLDIPGVREKDYIFYYYSEENPDRFSLEYYTKTLILPFVAGIILLMFSLVFWLEWNNIRNR